MMFRGSPGLSASQFSTISAALGGDSNADTQQVVTQYFLTVPSDALDTALRIEAIRMRAALNTEALWKLERGAIEQEVAQDLSNPQYIFYTRLLEALFADTPYAHDALGTRPSFDKTTGAMLDKFHRDWYGPNNAILVVVGDVDPDHALALVKRHFGPIPRRAVPHRTEVRLQSAQARRHRARYRPSVRPGRGGLPPAGVQEPRFRRGAGPGGRPGQQARKSLRPRAGREGALRGVRRGRPPGGRIRLRQRGVSPRGGRGRAGVRDKGDRRRLSRGRNPAGARGGGEAPRDRRRRVPEEFGGGACRGVVPGARRRRAESPRTTTPRRSGRSRSRTSTASRGSISSTRRRPRPS